MRIQSWPLVVLFSCIVGGVVQADDWTMFGRDATRNAVSPEKNPPIDFQVERRDEDNKILVGDRNVAWRTTSTSHGAGSPIVSNGLVWMCGNNETHFDPNTTKDAGCLVCFDARTGKFRWQHLTPRMELRDNDWPASSAASHPLVEGDRLYYVTNR